MTAAWVVAVLGFVVGLTYAAISAYWAIGGTRWLTPSVACSRELVGRAARL
jgi:hypothetical protein